jgi:adenylate cyclase
VSEFTYAKLRGTYRTREIDLVVVKGKTKPVAIHEILDYHSDETYPKLIDALGYFRDGLAKYRKGEWHDAVKQFSEVIAMNPADKAARLYVERSRHLAAHPPGDDWNGVWVMESK